MLETIVMFLAGAAFYAYLVIFAIGLAWVVVGLLLGGLEGMIEIAHDVATDVSHAGDSWGHQQVGLSPFSPLMIAVFGMLFGVTGMALEVFTTLPALVVLLVTLVVAVGLDAGFYTGLVRFFVNAQSTSLSRTDDAVGGIATVATRIAPGMTGTINYEMSGRRHVSGARAADGDTLEPGDVVRIDSLQGGVAQVSRHGPAPAATLRQRGDAVPNRDAAPAVPSPPTSASSASSQNPHPKEN